MEFEGHAGEAGWQIVAVREAFLPIRAQVLQDYTRSHVTCAFRGRVEARQDPVRLRFRPGQVHPPQRHRRIHHAQVRLLV